MKKANIGMYVAAAGKAKEIAPETVNALDKKLASRLSGPKYSDELLFAEKGGKVIEYIKARNSKRKSTDPYSEAYGNIKWEWGDLPMSKRKALAVEAGIEPKVAHKIAYKMQDFDDIMYGGYGTQGEANKISQYLKTHGVLKGKMDKGGKITKNSFSKGDKLKYKEPRNDNKTRYVYVEVKEAGSGGNFPQIGLNNAHTARWNGKDYELEDMAYTILEKDSKMNKGGKTDDTKYVVVFKNKSIPQKWKNAEVDSKGRSITKRFTNALEAKAYASRLNKQLSAGEKGFYKMKYSAVKYNPTQFIKYDQGGNISDKADYIPNRDIDKVDYKQKGKAKTAKGSDLLDGVYVKKKAGSTKTKKSPVLKSVAKKQTNSLNSDNEFLALVIEMQRIQESNKKYMMDDAYSKLLKAYGLIRISSDDKMRLKYKAGLKAFVGDERGEEFIFMSTKNECDNDAAGWGAVCVGLAKMENQNFKSMYGLPLSAKRKKEIVAEFLPDDLKSVTKKTTTSNNITTASSVIKPKTPSKSTPGMAGMKIPQGVKLPALVIPSPKKVGDIVFVPEKNYGGFKSDAAYEFDVGNTGLSFKGSNAEAEAKKAKKELDSAVDLKNQMIIQDQIILKELNNKLKIAEEAQKQNKYNSVPSILYQRIKELSPSKPSETEKMAKIRMRKPFPLYALTRFPKGAYFKLYYKNFGTEFDFEFLLDEVINGRVYGWYKFVTNGKTEWSYGDYIYSVQFETENRAFQYEDRKAFYNYVMSQPFPSAWLMQGSGANHMYAKDKIIDPKTSKMKDGGKIKSTLDELKSWKKSKIEDLNDKADYLGITSKNSSYQKALSRLNKLVDDATKLIKKGVLKDGEYDYYKRFFVKSYEGQITVDSYLRLDKNIIMDMPNYDKEWAKEKEEYPYSYDKNNFISKQMGKYTEKLAGFSLTNENGYNYGNASVGKSYEAGGNVKDSGLKEYQKLFDKLQAKTITPAEEQRLNILAFGEDFMKDEDKGKLRKYDESGKRVEDPDRDDDVVSIYEIDEDSYQIEDNRGRIIETGFSSIEEADEYARSNGYDVSYGVPGFKKGGKILDRTEMMSWLKNNKKRPFVSTTEDFSSDMDNKGIWLSKHDDDKIFDMYAKSSRYENGVLKSFKDQAEKRGWNIMFYDPSTIILNPARMESGGKLKSKQDDLKKYINNMSKQHKVDVEYGGYEEFDGENVFFIHYEKPKEKLVKTKLNEWVKNSKLSNSQVYVATDDFSDKDEGYWTIVIEQMEDQMEKGGPVGDKVKMKEDIQKVKSSGYFSQPFAMQLYKSGVIKMVSDNEMFQTKSTLEQVKGLNYDYDFKLLEKYEKDQNPTLPEKSIYPIGYKGDEISLKEFYGKDYWYYQLTPIKKNKMQTGGYIVEYLDPRNGMQKIDFEDKTSAISFMKNHNSKMESNDFADDEHYAGLYSEDNGNSELIISSYDSRRDSYDKGGSISKGSEFISPEGHKLKFTHISEKAGKARAAFLFSFDKKYEPGGTDTIENWNKLLKKDNFKPIMENGGNTKLEDIKEIQDFKMDILDERGFAEFSSMEISRAEAEEINEEAKKRYMKQGQFEYSDLGMMKTGGKIGDFVFFKSGRDKNQVRAGKIYRVFNDEVAIVNEYGHELVDRMDLVENPAKVDKNMMKMFENGGSVTKAEYGKMCGC